MNQTRWNSTVLTILAGLTLAWTTAASGTRVSERPSVPGFTSGGKRDESHDWTLGPTGARGWVYGWKGQTADARHIQAIIDARWELKK